MPDKWIKKEVRFPIMGKDTKHLHSRQPELSSVDAVNVRGSDNEDGRLRGGSRPGQLKAFSDQVGSGNRIQGISQVNFLNTTAAPFSDSFNDASLGDHWTLPYSSASLVYVHLGGRAQYSPSGGEARGVHHYASQFWGEMVLEKQFDLDTTAAYSVTVEYNGSAYEYDQYVYLRLPDTLTGILRGSADEEQDSYVRVHVERGASASEINIDSRYNGTDTAESTTSITHLGSNNFQLKLTMTLDSLEVFIDGVSVKVEALANSYTVQTGTRIGFKTISDNWVDKPGIENVGVDFTSTLVESSESRRLVTVCNGELWAENTYSQLEIDTGPSNLNSNLPIQGVTHLSKLYIADYGDKQTSGTTGAIDAAGTTMTVSGEDFTANYSIDTDNHILELYATDDVNTILGIYEISAVGTTTITLASSCNDGATTSNVSYRIERGPKIYDPALTLGSRLYQMIPSNISTLGTPPVGCQSVVRYRDRLSFTLALNDSHLWFQSRQGDPLDWNYNPASNDVGKAVAGQNSEAGALGEIVTCQISHNDDHLIFGSLDQIHILRGDATYGGLLDNISQEVGILGRDSWCYGPMGEIIFMSREGIYQLASGNSKVVESLSRDRMPRELINIDNDKYHVSMGYDAKERGIHIMVSPFDPLHESHHFYLAWKTKAFFPVKFDNRNHDPFAIYKYTSTDISKSNLLFGGRDGYIRYFNNDVATDDESPIKSMVAIGPFHIADDEDLEAVLEEISADLDTTSGCVKASIIVGENHEAVSERAKSYIAEVMADD